MNERFPATRPAADLPADFEVFFQQEQKAFLALAASRLRDRRDAEEAVLEAGRRMYAKWERILAHVNPVAMTYTILNGVIGDFYRREVRAARVQPFADPAATVPDSTYLQELGHHEALDLALDELESKAPMQANSVRLRHMTGLSYDEIAERLGTTPGSAKSSTCIGLQRLKAIMTRRGQ
ncbi:RNA polymerase sigma factor [Streptomyces sp. WAC01526]|uniref:RNA polymerase sigma factor n=1 Tax=Streptomyces sp. WAC01526 TaxID=2588709 RepID=UPI0011E0336B|nr:sigma-70 family RNA polymerase sigma factor [Streptomyces sp. WAC01526]